MAPIVRNVLNAAPPQRWLPAVLTLGLMGLASISAEAQQVQQGPLPFTTINPTSAPGGPKDPFSPMPNLSVGANSWGGWNSNAGGGVYGLPPAATSMTQPGAVLGNAAGQALTQALAPDQSPSYRIPSGEEQARKAARIAAERRRNPDQGEWGKAGLPAAPGSAPAASAPAQPAGLAVGTMLKGMGRAVSGNTLLVQGVTVTLAGLETPAPGEVCTDGKRLPWRCGDAARRVLERVVAPQKVTCTVLASTSPASATGNCLIGRESVSSLALLEGASFTNGHMHRDRQDEARSDKRGIWAAQR